MNAVNLIAMMFTAQEAVAPQTQTDSQLLPNSTEFLLQLQQQVLAGSSIAHGLLDSLPIAVEDVEAVFLQASLVGGSGAESGGQSWSLGEILAALIDSLRQVLDAGVTRNQAAAPAGDQSHASQDITHAGTAQSTGQFSATAALPAGWQAQQLLQAQWSEVVAMLGQRLAGAQSAPANLSATALTAGEPARLALAMPYTSALLIQQTVGATFTAVNGGDSPGYPLTTPSGILADAPASIQWFNSLGILGAQPVVAADSAAPAALTTEFQLPDGQLAKISLSELAQSMQLSQRSLAISIELPGEGTLLTATLTIQRVPPAAVAVMPGLQPGVTAQLSATIPVAGDGAGIVESLSATAAAKTEALGVISPTVGEQQPASNPAPVAVPQTQSVDGLHVDNGPAEVAGVTALTAEQPVEAGLAAALGIPAGKYALNNSDSAKQDKGYTVNEQLRPSLKAMPTLIGQVPAAERSATAKQTAVNRDSWTAQMALDQLNGAQEQPSIVTLKQQVAKPESQVQLATGQQPSIDAIEAVAVNATNNPLASQLMEFAGNSPQTAQHAGLEYLEMAERIMERVATARSAGNGLYNAHLDLNPPNLGKMFVNISVRGDAVALQIAVATTVPKEQLKDSLDALRQSLEEAGLYVVELQIHEIDGDEGNSSQQQSSAEHDGSEQEEGSAAVKTTPSLR